MEVLWDTYFHYSKPTNQKISLEVNRGHQRSKIARIYHKIKSKLNFSKIDTFDTFAQELHFRIQFVYYSKILKFDLYSEFVTSNDLCRPLDYFYWKVDVKGVILIHNLPYFMKVKNSTSFQIFDLGWPRVTSRPLFWNSDVKSVILIYNLPTFNVLRNLTLNEPKFVIWPQTQIFFTRNYSEIPLIILSYCLLRLVNLYDKTNTFCWWRNVEKCIFE